MSFVTEISPGRKIRVSPRYLKPDQLGGVIFDCTDMTIEECLTKQLFGLPARHYSYVQNIQPSLPLFLFNNSTRKLHGIFEAASSGQMNINPYGWTKDDSEKTPYPAQVQIRVQKDCHPLLEKQFKPIINKNYYTYTEFRFELDQDQVSKLIAQFSNQVIGPSASCNAYVDSTPHNESDGAGSSSCLRKIHQPVRTAIEGINQNKTNLICENLQKLPQRGESSNLYPTSKVQDCEYVNKMQSITAELQELNTFKQESIETISQLQQNQEKLWQEFNAHKQNTFGKIGQLQKSQQKLLQEFKAFKQESIKTTGQLQHSQQNLAVSAHDAV